MTAKVSDLLERCGFSKTTSLVLSYFIDNQGTPNSAFSVERKTMLRQPQVSLSLGYLKERKWISVSEGVNEGGKAGRPEKLYQLTNPAKIFETIEKDLQKEIAEKHDILAKLKSAMMAPESVVPEQLSKEGTA
jgi:predicted transcriptional regulator